MDKKYYSARHRRIKRGYYKRKVEKNNDNSTFILRLNICLGIAIILIGIFQLNPSIGDKIKSHLTVNTSADTVKNSGESIKEFVIDAKSVGFFNDDDFILDDESTEYINNLEKNSYYNKQKKVESQNEAYGEVWEKPVSNGTITDVFGSRNNPVTGKSENHKGIDIGVATNSEAKAVKSGVVIDTGYSNSYGNWVKYKTYDNYVIMYAHLTSVDVEKNQKIKQGQVLAHTGSTGNSTGPHLHYEIMKDNQYLNPYDYYIKGK